MVLGKLIILILVITWENMTNLKTQKDFERQSRKKVI